MPVRILFADGSRADANNLNDLYQRWQLRHEQEVKSRPKEIVREVQFIDYTNPQNVDQAYLMRDDLVNRINELQKWLGDKRPIDEYGRSLTKWQYHVHRNALVDELNYVRACIRMIKGIIAQLHREIYANKEHEINQKVRQVTAENGDIWFIQQAFTLLVSLKEKHGFMFDPTECEILDLLKKKLRASVEESQ